MHLDIDCSIITFLGVNQQNAEQSSVDGNSGMAIACGVIGVATEQYSPLGLPLDAIRLANNVVIDTINGITTVRP